MMIFFYLVEDSEKPKRLQVIASGKDSFRGLPPILAPDATYP
jgi:hypothetical protein